MKQSKELGISDLSKLGLSRGVAFLSDDEIKQARAIQKNAQEEGRKIQVKRNKRTGEINLFENGNNLGTLNKKGFSTADAVNLVKDPTNLLFAIPGVGQVGLGLRALRGLAKAGKLAKNSAKLATATATTDLGVSALANKAGGNNAIVDGDISRALTIGATAPVADLVVGGLAKGIKGAKGKIITHKSKTDPLQHAEGLAEKGVLSYTPGQSGNLGSAQLEDMARRGALNHDAQNFIHSYDKLQDKAIQNYLKDVFKVGRNKEISNEIKSEAGMAVKDKFKATQSLSREGVDKAYAHIEPILQSTPIVSETKDIIMSDLNHALVGDKGVFQFAADELMPDSYKTFKAVQRELPRVNNLQDLENLRRVISDKERAIYGSLEPNFAEQRAITALRKELDKSVDALTHNGGFSLSKDAIDKIKNARSLQQDYAKKFADYKDPDKKSFLKKVNKTDITGSEIIDALAKPKDNVASLTNLKNMKNIVDNATINEIKKGFLFEHFRKSGTNEIDVKALPKKIINIIDTDYAKELFSTYERETLRKLAKDLQPLIETAGRNVTPRPDLYDRISSLTSTISSLPYLGMFLAPINSLVNSIKTQYKLNKLYKNFAMQYKEKLPTNINAKPSKITSAIASLVNTAPVKDDN